MQKLTRNRTAYTGWLAAALVVGVVAGTGFQDSMKLGVVDLDRVILESKLQVEAQAQLQSARAARLSILDFMQVQLIMTREQCVRMRELGLKEDRTEAEETEILTIKSAVSEAIRDYGDIVNPVPPRPLTDEERLRLGDYTERKSTTAMLLQEWAREFEDEFQVLGAEIQREVIAKAQAAAQEVARREGYSIVFSMASAVYAGNDITDKAIEEANK